MKKFTLFILIFAISSAIFAQKYSTKSKKAVKRFEMALEHYRNHNYEEALKSTELALKSDENFIEVYLLLSDIYGKTYQIKNKISSLRKVIKINPEYSKMAYFTLAKTEIAVGLYSESLKNILEFEKRNKIEEYKSQISEIIARSKFGIEALKNPVTFKPENLGKNVNSKYADYHPVLTADEKTLIFTVGMPRPGIDSVRRQQDTQEDFFISNRISDTIWTKAKDFGKNFNTRRNEGAHTITADGRLMFFTACEVRQTGYKPYGDCFGSCDIYFSEKKGEKWTKPKNIGKEINTSAKETQPSISSDGRILYFLSNRKGGKGALDVWMSKKDSVGKWTKPVNLGDSINTAKNEQSPFIHHDNRTLYFASEGHIGMGRLDIFFSKKDENGLWSKAENLGYPINTYTQQMGLTINARGNKAYYAANYPSGIGSMDIYEFEIPITLRPLPVTFVQGLVFDKITRQKLSADFELFDLESDKLSAKSKSDEISGKFLITLPSGKDYALNVSKTGYLFYSEHFSLINLSDSLKTFYIKIPLQPIKFGDKVVLKNIFFDTDKFDLKKERTQLQNMYIEQQRYTKINNLTERKYRLKDLMRKYPDDSDIIEDYNDIKEQLVILNK